MRSRFAVTRSAVLIVCAFIVLFISPAEAGVVYVKCDSPGPTFDGTSWDTAFQIVQEGIDAAVAGDEVWVAEGTYVENITINTGVALYGGFMGDEASLDQRNWRSNKTILDGNGVDRVVLISPEATDSRIDGFAIENGYADVVGGGGIFCQAPSSAIANNTIRFNRAWGGGGILTWMSSAVLLNNVITQNTATSGGGGVRCYGGTPVLVNNLITWNRAGSAIDFFDSSPHVTNNTIIGNRSYGTAGGAIYADNSSSVVVNNIMAFNDLAASLNGGTMVFEHNSAFDNGHVPFVGMEDPIGTNGNISSDPGFASTDYGDWRIRPDSPCVDAGSAVAPGLPETDLDGNPRVIGATVDMGAYESDGNPIPPVQPNVVVRVSTDGDDTNDGSSWTKTKRSLQAAIDTASSLGGDVWVKAGVYVYCEPIDLRMLVHVYGGFTGTEDTRSERDPEANETILDGQHEGYIRAWQIPGGATIDGFTIRQTGISCTDSFVKISNNIVTEANGTGIYISGASPIVTGNTISDCRTGIRMERCSPKIIGNVISRNTEGGIQCVTSAPTITGNTIMDNSARDGGGILLIRSSGVIEENVIARNHAFSYGGGIALTDTVNPTFGGDPVIAGNTITGNDAFSGGGISVDNYGWVPTITGNVITENRGQSGGGAYLTRSHPEMAGNTIEYNRAAEGGGIYCLSTGGSIRANSIAYNQAATGGGILCQSSSPIVGNSIIGNRISAESIFAAGGGGVHAYRGSPTLVGNMIAANDDSGVLCRNCVSPTLVNNTITGSHQGLLCTGVSSLTMANNIVAFNGLGIIAAPSGDASLEHNCVYGNAVGDYSGVSPGADDFSDRDPGFADMKYGNLHLRPNSPCVDAGDDSAVEADWIDIDGQARTQGTHVDIGADESDGTVWPVGPRAIVHVSPDGSDECDGLSWEFAKRTVQAGVDAASALRGEVWVEADTYYERISLRPYSHLYGGFRGNETERAQRDWEANTTVLDGQQEGSVVSAHGGHLLTIDGFTIQNGTGTLCKELWALVRGGGIYLTGCAPTVTHNLVTGNSIRIDEPYSGDWPDVFGGGIYINGFSASVVDNTISDNALSTLCPHRPSPLGGVGLCCKGDGNRISGNTIVRNIFTTDPSSPVLTRGGGILVSGTADVSNNVVAENTALDGSGIYMEGYTTMHPPSQEIVNNTITGNYSSSTAYPGAALSVSFTPTLRVSNNVVAFNSAGLRFSYVGSASLEHNCVFGNNQTDYVDTDPGDTDISLDPLFADLDAGDFRLRWDSPCVDAGTNEGAPDSDMLGNPRPIDGDCDGAAITDIGAYEYVPCPLDVDVMPGNDGNVIRMWGNRMITVAVLGSEDFDVSTIDPQSVTFGPAQAVKVHKDAHIEDANRDGITDLVFHFRCSDTGLSAGDTVATLYARLTDGDPAMGSDAVTVVDR